MSTPDDHMSSPRLLRPSLVDYERSRSIAKLLQAQPEQACRNALRTVLEHIETGRYVEGLVVDTTRLPQVSEHAWVLTEDNMIVDPTPTFLAPTKDVVYLGVHQWYFEYLWETLDWEGILRLPMAHEFPSWGEECPFYMKALDLAGRHLAAVHLRDTGMSHNATELEDQFVRPLDSDYWLRIDD